MKRNKRRGSALIEFALALCVLVPLTVSTWQVGSAIHDYQRLHAAVQAAARYGARLPQTAIDREQNETAIRNMVVYGYPQGSETPLVAGLRPEMVRVEVDAKSVTVLLAEHRFDAALSGFTLRGKPSVTFPLLGADTPRE